MTKRPPPALATWLLEHFAPAYQRDSLIGDLIEQYHQGRTRLWYWQQVVTALAVGSTKALHPTVLMSAPKVLLRLTADSIAVTGLVALFYDWRRAAAPADLVRSALIATVVLLALIASLALRAPIKGNSQQRRHPTIKRLLAAFAAITLSVATLTWANTTTTSSPSTKTPAVSVAHR